MAQKETLLADDLRQRLELLELRFDQKKAAYTWEVRRVCWGGVSFDERSNLFSSVGIGARGASIGCSRCTGLCGWVISFSF